VEELARRAVVATESALQAGTLLRRGFGSDYKVERKGDAFDLVTEYDLLSEQLIVNTIRSHYPDDAILAEEGGASGDLAGGDLWIIDPLDGTVNFAHNLPLFAVSIAAVHQGELLCAAIYQPMTQELFLAQKGEGATLNGEPIFASKTEVINGALVATSLSFHRHTHPNRSLERFAGVALETKGVAALGSAVMNLAYVAAGRYDAYWTSGGALQPWDFAAASLLIGEAGGEITGFGGAPLPLLESSDVVASNRQIHEELLVRLS